MSGIGIEFRRIYRRHDTLATLRTLGLSMVNTIAPMLLIMLVLSVLYDTTDYQSCSYASRELLSVSMTYVFIFSLLTSAITSNPISRFLSDVLYVRSFEQVMPGYIAGLGATLGIAGVLGTGFCVFTLWRGVDPLFAVLSLACYVAMTLVFFNMTFVSACRSGARVALYFLVGMGLTLLLGFVFNWLSVDALTSIQLAMLIGLTTIAALQYGYLSAAFTTSDHNYKRLWSYVKDRPGLHLSSLLYTLGLFSHNFVYWCSSLGMSVAGCYRYAPVYDKAAFLGMYTSVLSGVIFFVQVSRHFTDRYREFSDLVNVSRYEEIVLARERMFRMVDYVLSSTIKLSFICTTGLFFLFMVVLPGMGYYGITSDLYPCLAAGYFTMYIMYSQQMLLDYLTDKRGSLWCSCIFLSVTILASALGCLLLPYDWQGIGLFAGSLAGTTFSFFRLKWLYRHFDAHIFCSGQVVKKQEAPLPDSCVYKSENA